MRRGRLATSTPIEDRQHHGPARATDHTAGCATRRGGYPRGLVSLSGADAAMTVSHQRTRLAAPLAVGRRQTRFIQARATGYRSAVRGTQLMQYLAKRIRNAPRLLLPTQARQVIHFVRVRDLRQRLRVVRRDGHEQQPVAEPNQLQVMATGQRRATQDLEHVAGQRCGGLGKRPTRQPHDKEEQPQHDGQTAQHDRRHVARGGRAGAASRPAPRAPCLGGGIGMASPERSACRTGRAADRRAVDAARRSPSCLLASLAAEPIATGMIAAAYRAMRFLAAGAVADRSPVRQTNSTHE